MRVLILGAGGHAQVVADILLRARQTNSSIEPIGYLDDNQKLIGQTFVDLPVLGTISDLSVISHDAIIVAIGDNATRQRVFEVLRKEGKRFAIARHPSSIIAPDVQIGEGTMICAGVVINTGSVIGANVILNTGCTVDHHNQIGDHAHIAPGVHMGGEVSVGDGALVGIGCTIMPRCSVAARSIIGAGSLVNKDIPTGVTAVGVPAKVIQRHDASQRGHNH